MTETGDAFFHGVKGTKGICTERSEREAELPDIARTHSFQRGVELILLVQL